MSNFVPGNGHLREVMIFMFHQKKKAAECHRILHEIYGDCGLAIRTVETWYRRFKSGDFSTDDAKRSGRPQTFEDTELQALLDEDDTQTQKMMADQLNSSQQSISDRLRAMGKIQKSGKWVPHELTEAQRERRKVTCEMLLARHGRKSFLHRIVTGDEKWIYFENPKKKKSWVDPGQPSTSTARPNRFGKKAMLCVWWDQQGVLYYELLKPGETVNAHRYHRQLIKLRQAINEKRPEFRLRHDKLVFQHDNAPAHNSLLVRNYLDTVNWEILAHPPYSPDVAPSDYYLFSSMAHALKEQHFASYEEVGKWLDEWFATKSQEWYWRGIHKLPERWEKCVASDGQYFE